MILISSVDLIPQVKQLWEGFQELVFFDNILEIVKKQDKFNVDHGKLQKIKVFFHVLLEIYVCSKNCGEIKIPTLLLILFKITFTPH